MAKTVASRKSLFIAIGITCFISVILNSSDIWAHIYALSPRGSTVILNGMFIIMIPLMIALFLIILGLLGLLVKSIRTYMVFLVLCSFIYFVAGIVTLRISGYITHSIRNTAFRKLAQRSQSLIKAVRAYEQAYGNPPDSLQKLVPEFISEVPNTGMGGYPEYRYLSGENAMQWTENPWVIFVETPIGILNWDLFMYFPLQNYPEIGYGGYLEKIDDWAYVHE
ncbi:MAG: hypothetical protein ISS71_00060 [Phycisphaerae bacterium]|nr:hypothetical protein [Phycisphaerae bacterium]